MPPFMLFAAFNTLAHCGHLRFFVSSFLAFHKSCDCNWDRATKFSLGLTDRFRHPHSTMIFDKSGSGT